MRLALTVTFSEQDGVERFWVFELDLKNFGFEVKVLGFRGAPTHKAHIPWIAGPDS